MGFLVPLLLFYALPFALVIGMPGWRSLFACGVLMGAAVAWAMLTVGAAFDHPFRDPGIGAVFSLMLYEAAGVGLAAGVTARAVILVLRMRRVRRVISVGLAVFAFVAPPAASEALQAWRSWVRRPPPPECLQAQFPIELAGMTYVLPAAPLFTVITGRDDLHDRYMFELGPHLREFCALSRGGTQPVHAIALHLGFFDTKRYYHYPLWEGLCRRPPAPWMADFCQPDADPEALHYPFRASVYSPSEYDHRRNIVSDLGTYDRFRAERAAGRYWQMERVGDFERYTGMSAEESYWIAAQGTWATAGGVPFTLFCNETKPAGTLYCTTTHLLESGLQITYDFHARTRELEGTVKVVDDRLRNFLASLAAREPTP